MTDHAIHSRSGKTSTSRVVTTLYGTFACALLLAGFLCAIALAGNLVGPATSDSAQPAPPRPSLLIRTAG